MTLKVIIALLLIAVPVCAEGRKRISRAVSCIKANGR
jgi:hypothetical protein